MSETTVYSSVSLCAFSISRPQTTELAF